MSTSPRHVLYIAEFTTGGSVESMHSLISGLDREQYRPTVLFYVAPSHDIQRRFEEIDVDVMVLTRGRDSGAAAGYGRGIGLQQRIRNRLGRSAEAIYSTLKYVYIFGRHRFGITLALRRRIRQLAPDLVHLNNGPASDTPGIVAARLCRLPIICHVRALATVYAPPQLWATHLVSTFVCVSTTVRDHLTENGVSVDKTVVCNDAVNQQRFRKFDVDRNGIMADLGFEPTDIVFGLIGRLDLWKGHRYFIDAIAIARRRQRKIRGVIIGDAADSAVHCKYVDDLREQVLRLDLAGSVRFSGHRQDVPEIMQCLTAVVCASSTPEPFGLMVVEGMAVGTPVIATDAGGPSEMITDGVDGLLVPIRNADAMADAMLRLAEDPKLVADIAEAGQKKVGSHFTVARHVACVCKVYDRTLRG